jgi:CubicO group peptidase (beta-lactamase class C family)
MALDDVLRSAVETKTVPSVVAMAAGDRGILYSGAAGTPIDTVFRLMSMTKAITCVAAMQLVEQGKLMLEEPVPNIDPTIGAPRVLEGFDDDGNPKLRPAKRPITLRHLLTHTAGFAYEAWDPLLARYVPMSGMPAHITGKVAAMRMPLVFDPGDRWQYGISIDWVGLLIESVSGTKLDVYLRDHIFVPLGMKDTAFVNTPEQRTRRTPPHQRSADGSLVALPLETPFTPEFWAGGGGLYATGRDYLTFLQMLLHGGTFERAQILKPETVELMHQNHVGDIQCGILKTENPARSNDVDFFPGQQVRWSLGGLLNIEDGPNGRSAGSVSWGGLYNGYHWLDPVKRVAGTILMQIVPFGDHEALKLYGRFERGVYDLL